MFVLITSLFLTLNPYLENTETEKLIEDLATGFISITYQESKKWYDCGIPTQGKKEWFIRADYMARVLFYEMKEQKLDVSIWGIWGVIWKESRGNKCAIGPNPRQYAYDNKIIKPLNPHLWTEEKIHATLNHSKWRNRSADLGLCQVVWKRYSRIPDTNSISGERVPTIEEAISIEGGLKICVHAMKKRSQFKKRYRKIPWILWPSIRKNTIYVNRIARIVKRMKGPYKEVLGQ